MSKPDTVVIYSFMPHISKSLIVCFSILLASDMNMVHCQNTDTTWMYKLHYDSLYGMDPYLYSGIKYFPEHFFARGFPFWKEEKPMMADMVISGRLYQNLKIRFNLYSQEFILEYPGRFGGLQQIVLNRLIIDSVFTNDVLFIKNKYSDIKEYFLQVIYEDEISCYFTRKKNYQFDNSGVETGHEYSNEIVISYLVKEGKAYVFTNNASFLKIFPADKRISIRQFLKENRIKVKRKIQTDMVRLFTYCNKPDL